MDAQKNDFKKLLNSGTKDDAIYDFIYLTAEPQILKPTLAEVMRAIKQLKNHKSPDLDQIPAELT